jgi:hypothetical protein
MLEAPTEKAKEAILKALENISIDDQKDVLKWMHDEYKNYMMVSSATFEETLTLIETEYRDSPLNYVVDVIREHLSQYAGANVVFHGTNRVIIANNWEDIV